MSEIAFIFARGGSKGVKNKNFRLLAGKPLIGWAIEQALSVRQIDKVLVSTDSLEIARISESFGAEVPFIRPSHLATDASPEMLSWRHAIEFVEKSNEIKLERFISVPPTAPLRIAQDIENCISEYELGGCDAVVSVTESNTSPYFNMVTRDKSGNIELIIKPQIQLGNRQSAPEVFNLTTACYVANTKFVKQNLSITSGILRSVIVPQERAIDIDNELDFVIAELLMKRRIKTERGEQGV
jgi:N-acylneuraminate cytidylyltransferase